MGLLVTLTRMGAECDFWALGGSRPACRIGSAPSRSRSLRRARTYTCVSCHAHARRRRKKKKPFDLLRFCRGRMKMKQQESGITRARSASSSFSRPYKISTASHQPGVQIHPARARLALAPCTANPRTPFSSPELSLQASPGLTSCRL